MTCEDCSKSPLARACWFVLTVATSVGLSIAIVNSRRDASTPSSAPVALISSMPTSAEPRWITLHQLEQSLGKPPVDVVFDIDDTLLFTSAAFQWGSRQYGKDIVSAGASIREEDLKTEDERQKYREFWAKLNNELDQYSVPKWIATELIKMHKGRGDRIHFVTKRIFTGSEKLTPLLHDVFDLPNGMPVIFTNRKPKVEAFKQVQATISYGDSDGDIRDSIAAGARPIRVLRARTSVNVEPVHNGAFGEEVLINSEF